MIQQQRVGPLAEGAFLALMTAVLGALALYFLPIKVFFDLAWGIPIIIAIKKHNLQIGILTIVTAFFLTLLFTDPVRTVFLFIQLAPTALVFGLLLKHGISSGTTLVSGAAVSALSAVIWILLLLYIDPVSILPAPADLARQAGIFSAIYIKWGLITAEEAKKLAESLPSTIRIVVPSMIIFSSVIRAFVTYLLTAKVMRRMAFAVTDLPPFSEWRLPWYSVWPLITGLVMMLTGDEYNVAAAATIGRIIVYSLLPVFMIMGLAVFKSLFRRWNLPVWMKVLTGFMALINLVGTLVLITMVGIFDPLISFRDWRKPKDE